MEIQLHYLEKGSGEVLFLLHGNGEDHNCFRKQIDEFAGHFRVIALDTRGHGASPRGTAPFTITQFAEDLYDFMREKKISSANILGFSDGGNIALSFALRHPEMVKKLVLNGANLYPDGVKKQVKKEMEETYEKALKESTVSEQAKRTAELYALMIFEPQIEPSELKALDIPTLVLAGENDVILRAHTRLIHKNIKNSRLVLLPGDHFIVSENAQAYNRAVLDFLLR